MNNLVIIKIPSHLRANIPDHMTHIQVTRAFCHHHIKMHGPDAGPVVAERYKEEVQDMQAALLQS